MKKNIARILCLALILPIAGAWKCNPAQSITLAQAGYQTHVYALAAVKTARAINSYQPSQLQNGTYGKLLRNVDSLDEFAERLFLRIDETPIIGPENKLQLLTEADAYAALADSIIADRVFPSLPDSLRETILIGRTIASGIKLAISTIQTVQPTAKVLVSAGEANAKAVQASKQARSKSNTSDLINALSQVVADTAADVLAAKGLDVVQVRTLRKDKRNAVRSLVNDELAKLNR